MKNTIFTAVLLLLYASSRPQDCRQFYFFQDHKTIEMTVYNKKGEATGKQVYQVALLHQDGPDRQSSVHAEMFDNFGHLLSQSEGEFKCTGGMVMASMKLSIPQQTLDQFRNADVKAKDNYLEYPAKMKPGEHLKDGQYTMVINNGGKRQELTMTMNNRKVLGKESVTTPVGTWECYKISYKARLAYHSSGMDIPFDFAGIEYFAPGFGIVKTESKSGDTAITSVQ